MMDGRTDVPMSAEVATAAYVAEVEDFLVYLMNRGISPSDAGPRIVRIVERYVDCQVADLTEEIGDVLRKLEG